jgi:hypothetical protein
MSQLYEEIWTKVKDVNLPSYRRSVPEAAVTPGSGMNSRNNGTLIHDILHDSLIPAILAEDVQKVRMTLFFVKFARI